MRVSLSANLLSWLTRAIHSWSSWLPTPSPVVSQPRKNPSCYKKLSIVFAINSSDKVKTKHTTQNKKKNQVIHLLTIFVFLFVLFLAFLTGWLALRGLRRPSLSRTAGASAREGRRGGAGHHFTATEGAGEQLQKHWWNALVHQEANLQQEIQDSCVEKTVERRKIED